MIPPVTHYALEKLPDGDAVLYLRWSDGEVSRSPHPLVQPGETWTPKPEQPVPPAEVPGSLKWRPC